jgi:predicted Zn finger-like uncharacterized protein
MIIACLNCKKKFEIDSGLIPDKGRLLQCNGCNHQWFFKKENINKLTSQAEIDEPDELRDTTQTNAYPEAKKIEEDKESEKSETIELLDKTFKNDSEIEKNLIQDKSKTKQDNNIKTASLNKGNKKYNILSLFIVFVLSFISIIIVLDTFQAPISKIFPNIKIILYNLYETIKDIELFFKDLI